MWWKMQTRGTKILIVSLAVALIVSLTTIGVTAVTYFMGGNNTQSAQTGIEKAANKDTMAAPKENQWGCPNFPNADKRNPANIQNISHLIEWKPLPNNNDGVEYPTVKGNGPGKFDKNGVPMCYPKTTLGATLAAMSIANIANTKMRYAYMEHYLLSKDRESLLAGVKQFVDNYDEIMKDNTSHYIVTRFQIVSATDGNVRVRVGADTADGKMVDYQMNMVWQDGQWMWNIPTQDTPVFTTHNSYDDPAFTTIRSFDTE